MKVNVKNHTMMYPAPAVVASAYDEEGKADACTLAFATMCSHHPPAVMIAINSTLKRKTIKSILHFKRTKTMYKNLVFRRFLSIFEYHMNKLEIAEGLWLWIVCWNFLKISLYFLPM